MKGKRKVRTTKWYLEEQLKIHAQKLLANRSQKFRQRFLIAAAALDIDQEPIGMLAGCSHRAHRNRQGI